MMKDEQKTNLVRHSSFLLHHFQTDALAEAGCSNPDILSHWRGPGPHVRGCWVVDGCWGRSTHDGNNKHFGSRLFSGSLSSGDRVFSAL
jgi:hypothetical protein